jgi:hypothetical protein
MEFSPATSDSPGLAIARQCRARPFYRIHVITWIILMLVAVALADLQFERRRGARLGEGWPLRIKEYELRPRPSHLSWPC